MSPLKELDEVQFYQWSKQATKKYPEKSLRTFWPDGCSSQFKSQHVFLDLTDLDRDIELEWDYFESNQGKGAVDSIGGCAKQKVFKHVRSFKVVLSNAEEFASYANKVVEVIDIIYKC